MKSKALIFFSAFFLLLSISHFVLAEPSNIDAETLNKIFNKLNDQEKQINTLKNQIKQKSKTVKSGNAGYMEQDIEELSERMDKVEIKSILNKVSVSGSFRTRFDSLHFKDATFSGTKKNPHVDELWTNRVRINLVSEINDDLVFHGRLGAFKFWGDTEYDRPRTDVNAPSIPANGDIRVEQAYIDYFIPDSQFAVTFGRIPTSEGPPKELKNNTTRKATWPALLVDGEIDGIMSTVSLEKWTDLNKSFLRVGYGMLNCNYYNYNDAYPEFDTTKYFVMTFEMEAGVKNSLLWLSYAKLVDLPSLKAPTIPLPTGTLTRANYPKEAGDMDYAHLHLQFNDIDNKGLDIFTTIGYINYRMQKRGTVYTDTAGNLYEFGLHGDSLNNNLGDDEKAFSIFAGLRYKISSESLNDPKIGFEYNHGSRYWAGMYSDGSGDIYNKLGVLGDAYELYYIQPIDKKNMFLRFGAVYMECDYFNPLAIYGKPEKSDMTVTNFYVLADVRF